MIEQTFAVALAAVAGFAALAHGAHDLWAATVVHLAAVFLAAAWVARGALVREASVSTRFSPPFLLIVGAFWLSWRGSVNPGESLLALQDWAPTCSSCSWPPRFEGRTKTRICSVRLRPPFFGWNWA